MDPLGVYEFEMIAPSRCLLCCCQLAHLDVLLQSSSFLISLQDAYSLLHCSEPWMFQKWTATLWYRDHYCLGLHHCWIFLPHSCHQLLPELPAYHLWTMQVLNLAPIYVGGGTLALKQLLAHHVLSVKKEAFAVHTMILSLLLHARYMTCIFICELACENL